MPRIAKDALQTKRGNYLLRSTRRDDLLDLMALVHAGRVVAGQVNAHLIKADNTWAGHATWGARTLEEHGLIAKSDTVANGRRAYELTSLGHKALSSALNVLGRRIDTAALMAEVDASRME